MYKFASNDLDSFGGCIFQRLNQQRIENQSKIKKSYSIRSFDKSTLLAHQNHLSLACKLFSLFLEPSFQNENLKISKRSPNDPKHYYSIVTRSKKSILLLSNASKIHSERYYSQKIFSNRKGSIANNIRPSHYNMLEKIDSNTTLLLNKPINYLSSFTCPDLSPPKKTLAHFIPKNINNAYPAGRLDEKSEGLIVITSSRYLVNAITGPENVFEKIYYVLVSPARSDPTWISPSQEQLKTLANGIKLSDKEFTKPCIVEYIGETLPELLSNLCEPIFPNRKQMCWLKYHLKEGRNRQIRRMNAKVGLSTLRIIRTQIGPWKLDIKPGDYRDVTKEEMKLFWDKYNESKYRKNDNC